MDGLRNYRTLKRFLEHSITALSRFCGAEEATTLVNAVFEKKSHIAVSNLLPLDYFPVPQDYIVDRLAEQTSKQESLKDKRAAVKRKGFCKTE